MLTEEQAQEMRSNIIQQISSTFPEDKKQTAISQVEAMSIEELEQFIEQNQSQQAQKQGEGQCIFCSIVEGKVPSYEIEKNKTMISILELNPVSKGHVLVIPKNHSTKSMKRAISFAGKIEKKLKTKLKPKEVRIASSNLFGHEIVNVVPIYDNENLDSPRYKAEESELKEVQKLLLTKKAIRKPRTQKIKETKEKKLWLPKRIP
jgi:histidine triad (HIT) family protein